ncbi:MAG: hypothetical protein KKF46_06045 [Nanoarchaeota archaeon]|nr:hypothetical protein [Nanoarchaeota archaeon]MBU1321894.1 hypothetical protein [Nanoarchaeota archaeon]MBU1597669.1 hypothetical protein [Nanoarchaeota archaeon]MBU2442232.1 hypothetical protein [Nanoarchaeota archaeon]
MANIDINQMVNELNQAINRFVQQVQAYFKSLSQFELYAWIAMGVGLILVIIALVTW